MSTTKTRTKTETRTRMETEEVDLYECPGCGQFVEEDELVPLLVDVDVDEVDSLGRDLVDSHSRVLCTYCTHATWDYDPNGPHRVRRVLEATESTLDVAWRVFKKALPLLVSILVVLLATSIIFDQMAQAAHAVDSTTATQPAFDQVVKETDAADSPFIGFLGLVPLMTVGFVVVVQLSNVLGR